MIMATAQKESRTQQANKLAGDIPTQANQMAAEIAQKANDAMKSIGADTIKLVRSNPISAALVALGVGILIARITNRS
jgi:F0F1-type ATP synthase assembly protein I